MKRFIGLMGVLFLVGGLLIFLTTPVWAEDKPVDEGQLFPGDDSTVSSDGVVKNNVDSELQQKRIGISGEVKTQTIFNRYASAWDWLNTGDSDSTQISNEILADLFVDIRLTGGIKSFISLETSYLPSNNNTQYDLKEFFLDVPWNNKVYFRMGKQVLKWGTCYFWNPTDMINIDHKNFLDMNQLQEGTYGTKIQIPSGTKSNTYFFIKMDNANTAKDISLAAKYEFLVKDTEMSFSTWFKEDYKTVYGYDISGRLLDMDVRGELAVSDGDNDSRMIFDPNYNNYIIQKETGHWIPRASIGFTKYFTQGEIKDRISLNGELYFNGNGSDKNIFRQLTDGQRGLYLSQVYQPYRNSKYYFALFGSFAKFITPDYTLNVNDITNLIDHSGTLTGGITYHPTLSDLFIDFNLNGNYGGRFTEATFSGDTLSLYLGVKIQF